MIEAFSHCFPDALQLRYFINSVKEKLKEYGIPSLVAEELVADIFGKCSGSSYKKGLVDSTSPKKLQCSENCKTVWNAQKNTYALPI